MLSVCSHKMILEQTGTFEKEAYFLLLLTQLCGGITIPFPLPCPIAVGGGNGLYF